MFRTLIVYDWPASQICLACKNGEPISIGIEEDSNNSAVCTIDCKLSDGN